MIERVSREEIFLRLIKKQNIEWGLIDNGVIEEDVPIKPLAPKKETIKVEKIKKKQYI